MKSIGIITIHKINNYGSVLQAYALQRICELLGYTVEIIDYTFPNEYHKNNTFKINEDKRSNEPLWIKVLFIKGLRRQHKGIASFVRQYHNLSAKSYNSPDELYHNPPNYDIYMTGSDQLWNPRHCNGDPAYMLKFAPDTVLKLSYAASIGTNKIPNQLHDLYHRLLSRYDYISVRETSGTDIIKDIVDKDADVVLDPTLLLNNNQWNEIAVPTRIINEPYILCYFLNYSFNAFPYSENFAEYIQKETGYKLVFVSRPPHKLRFANRIYKIGANPHEFLALVRDAEIVLTTSFHGTAFAINFGRPVFSLVADKNSADSRQSDLLRQLDLTKNLISVKEIFPKPSQATYNVLEVQSKLDKLRDASLNFLKKALRGNTHK